jgi:hypothetical protein
MPPAGRSFYYGSFVCFASPFISEIPAQFICMGVVPDKPENQKPGRQNSLF